MFDANQRESHFKRMQEIVSETVPFINVFWRINGILAAEGVGGFTLPPDNQQADLREVFYIIGWQD
jgi:ABC-type transport system substrate-binding protein